MTNFLQRPEVAQQVDAFLTKLEQGGPVSHLDFPPSIGMTEDLFYAIADEIAHQLDTNNPSPIH